MAPPASWPDGARSVEGAFEGITDARGIRAASRSLHDLTDEPAERLRLAGAVDGRLSRVLAHNLEDDGVHGGRVGDPSEPARAHDRIGLLGRVEHRGEDFLRRRGGYLSRLDEPEESREPSGSHGKGERVLGRNPALLQPPEDLSRDPDRRRTCRGRSSEVLEVVAELPSGDERLRVAR